MIIIILITSVDVSLQGHFFPMFGGIGGTLTFYCPLRFSIMEPLWQQQILFGVNDVDPYYFSNRESFALGQFRTS
jgi:hypothetical protein